MDQCTKYFVIAIVNNAMIHPLFNFKNEPIFSIVFIVFIVIVNTNNSHVLQYLWFLDFYSGETESES